MIRKVNLPAVASAVGRQGDRERMQLLRVLLEYAAAEKDREVRALLMRDLVMRYSAAEIRLKELNDLKNRFLGIAAHDLRNPLASIRGFSELLLEGDAGPITEEQQEFLTVIHDASEHMLALVNDILDVSVIESGKLDVKLLPASLVETVESRVRIQEMVARNKNIAIRSESAVLSRPLLFDQDRIGQVVDNLIGNAIKFSPPGSEVWVRIMDQTESARVEVRDHGPGVSPEDRGKLFAAFQKLSARPTAGERSTGLGLSIARSIIEAHHGTIGVESEPGRGSTFYFTLPFPEQEDS